MLLTLHISTTSAGFHSNACTDFELTPTSGCFFRGIVIDVMMSPHRPFIRLPVCAMFICVVAHCVHATTLFVQNYMSRNRPFGALGVWTACLSSNNSTMNRAVILCDALASLASAERAVLSVKSFMAFCRFDEATRRDVWGVFGPISYVRSVRQFVV